MSAQRTPPKRPASRSGSGGRLRLRPAGLVFGTLCFGTAVLGLSGPHNFVLLLACCLGAVFLFSAWYPVFSLRWIDVSRRVPQDVFVGRTTRVRLFLRQRSALFPACALAVRDLLDASVSGGGGRAAFLRVAPRSVARGSYEVRFLRRGRVEGGAFSLGTSFPFGFFRAVRRDRSPGRFVVYPRLRYVDRPLRGSFLAGTDRPAPERFGPEEEFRRLREYVPGDAPRRVHWKASARQGRLLVREDESFERRKACIVLDTVPARRKKKVKRLVAFERGVSLAASAAVLLEKAGWEYRLVLPGDRGGGPEREGARLRAALLRLALVRPGRTPLAEALAGLRAGPREEIVVVAQDRRAAAEAREALGARAGTVLDASRAFPPWNPSSLARPPGGLARKEAAP